METYDGVGEVNELLSHYEYDLCQKDDKGRLIYYSHIYEWKDGTFHDVPDPAHE